MGIKYTFYYVISLVKYKLDFQGGYYIMYGRSLYKTYSTYAQHFQNLFVMNKSMLRMPLHVTTPTPETTDLVFEFLKTNKF